MWPFNRTSDTPSPSPAAANPWGAPGPSKGILARLRQIAGGWLGPRLSRHGPAEKELTSERAASGPRGVVLPQFAPYIDNYTQETAETRAAYRRMWADPNVRSAILGKVLDVAGLDLGMRAADKTRAADREQAEFASWLFKQRCRGGVPALVWSILSGACTDGYAVCEKVRAREEKGRWAGNYVLADLKPKLTGDDVVLQTDEFLNVVGVMGLRYNGGREFSPTDFVIYRLLPLYNQATGMSDMRAVYSRWWLLDTALKLRALALEKRALPLLKGTYRNPAHKASLENALGLAKSSWWLSLPEGTQVEVLNIAGEADQIFAATIRDLKHDIFLGIRGAVLQNLEGTTSEARGNTQVHQSEAETFNKFLASSLEAIFNDRETGLVREFIDLNYVAEDYPVATLSAIDVNELLQEVQVDDRLHAWGMPLSKEELYDRYNRTPPKDDEDTLPGAPQPGGGGPGPQGPAGGALPFADVNLTTGKPKLLAEPPREGAAAPFRFSEEWARYLAG